MTNDTKRLHWLEGNQFSLISDDGGRWTCTCTGIQNVPEEHPINIYTTFFIEAIEWKDSIREAIDYAKKKFEGEVG